MKAILEFDLNEPDDREAHLRATMSLDMAIAIWDMQQEFRGRLKHGQLSDEEYRVTEELKDRFYQILNERGIDLEKLMS
jgi:hypothetical protein